MTSNGWTIFGETIGFGGVFVVILLWGEVAQALVG